MPNLVDNISLTENDPCFDLCNVLPCEAQICTECEGCSPTDGCIITCVDNTGDCDCDDEGDYKALRNEIHSAGANFAVVDLANVSQFHLQIFTVDGILIRNIELEDPPNIISWDGRNEAGVDMPSASYPYKLFLANDCHSKTISRFIIKTTGAGSTLPIPHPEPVEKVDYTDACCYDEMVLEFPLDQFTSPFFTMNTEFISSGTIVISGDVLAAPGVVVTFQAAESVIIDGVEYTESTVLSPGVIITILDCFQLVSDDETNSLVREEGLNIINSIPLENPVKEKSIVKDVPSLVLEKKLSVRPNPNNGEFTIDYHTPNESLNSGILVIYDIFGTIHYQNAVQIKNGQISLTINDYNLSSGIYFVGVIEEGGVMFSQKMIIN